MTFVRKKVIQKLYKVIYFQKLGMMGLQLKNRIYMMSSSYKSILPVAIAFIGGMIVAAHPASTLAITQEYTPTDRSEPKRTQGGGSRLSLTNESVSSMLIIAN